MSAFAHQPGVVHETGLTTKQESIHRCWYVLVAGTAVVVYSSAASLARRVTGAGSVTSSRNIHLFFSGDPRVSGETWGYRACES